MSKQDPDARFPAPRDPAPDEHGEIERIDAGELARLDAEREARNESHEEERAALARVWREQQDYARVMEEQKAPEMRRVRLVPQIVLATLIAVAILGAIVYSVQQQRQSEAEALRVTAELVAQQEEQERAKLAVAESEKARAKPEAAADAVPAAPAPAVTEEAKQADERAKALELRIRDEARRRAVAAAKKQAEAMALAEERAKAVAATTVREAPRAAPPRPGSVFQDCAECPRMMVVPAGEFTMGSPASEAGRGQDEGPQRTVAIAQPFALGRSEVTVAEFRRFTEESGYKTEAERDTRARGCSGFVYADPASGQPAPLVTSWRSPGLAQAQADSHPVLCVSWNDARAYAQWVSKKTGKRYRLPTEAEWEYAARAGSTSARYWGDDPAQACRYGNIADQSRLQTWGFGQKHECTDGHYFTAPAGGYAPNRFGLYDMIGNVWEWTEDCWNPSYAGAPADGSAWLSGDCGQRIERGGSWSTVPGFARSATRHKNAADYRDNLTGFRLARTLD